MFGVSVVIGLSVSLCEGASISSATGGLDHSPGGVSPAAPPVVDAPLADEYWEGSVTLPTKDLLAFSVRFSGTLSARQGFLSIPIQGLVDGPLVEVSVGGRALRFTFDPRTAEQRSADQLRGAATPPSVARFRFTVDEIGVGVGTLQQGGKMLEARVSRLDAGTLPSAMLRPQTPKGPFEYTTREVTITGAVDNTTTPPTPPPTLAGTLVLPKVGSGSGGWSKPLYSAVVFITGSGPQDRDETIFGHKPFAVLADELAKRGVASLRMDDRGVGGSTSPKAGQETTLDFVADITAAATWLSQQPEINRHRIGLIGHSEGGLIAPMVGAANAELIRFVVMIAGPGVNGTEILIEQVAAMSKAGGMTSERIEQQRGVQRAALESVVSGQSDEQVRAAVEALILSQMGLKVRPVAKPDDAAGNGPAEQFDAALKGGIEQLQSPWMRQFLTLDPALALRAVKCPVLVIAGSMDVQVVSSQNVPAIAAALLAGGNNDFTVRVMPRLNHLLQPAMIGTVVEYASINTTMSPEAIEVIGAWVEDRARPKTSR